MKQINAVIRNRLLSVTNGFVWLASQQTAIIITQKPQSKKCKLFPTENKKLRIIYACIYVSIRQG